MLMLPLVCQYVHYSLNILDTDVDTISADKHTQFKQFPAPIIATNILVFKKINCQPDAMM